ncbi:MAG: hypothetical protein ACK502_01570 [Alphaproteobacteria bacterium]
MRKVLLVGISTLLVVVGVVFCVSWFIQSGEMKKVLEQTIAKINEKQTYITYESIDVSGFPTHIALSLVNPRFSGRVDQLLQTLQVNQHTPPVYTLPEWHEDVSLIGALTFTVNALSNHYTFKTSGKWQKSGTLAGKSPQTIASKGIGENICSLTLARSSLFSNFWNYNITTENAEEFLKEIRELDCNSPAYTITDTQSNAILINSGPTRIYFSSIPKDTQQEIRLFIKSSDAEVTTDGDKLIASYIMALSPDYQFPPLFSAYGKQNLDVDFVYNGLIDFNSAHTDTNIDINLGTFNISNDVYNTKGYLRLTNQNTGDKRTASINTRFESTYSELYDAIIRDTVRNFIHQATTSSDPELQKIRSFLQLRTAEENFALVEPIIPNLYSLGTQISALNASYTGSSNFMAGDYNLSELAITATPYGITGSGTAKSSPSNLYPQANATLICTNCMQLIDDIMRYAGRVSGMIQAFSSEPPPFLITPALIDGTKKFFHTLSSSTPEERNKGHYSYTVVSEPTGNVLISGRNIADVMAMYAEYIGQEVHKSQESVPPQGWKVD